MKQSNSHKRNTRRKISTVDPEGRNAAIYAKKEISSHSRKKAKEKDITATLGCFPDVDHFSYGEDGELLEKNEGTQAELWEQVSLGITNWFIDAGIPFHYSKSETFKRAMEAIAQSGIGSKPPTEEEVRGPLLQKEKQRIKDILKVHKEEYPKYGCTLMCGSLRDPLARKDIMYFLVNCPKGTMYLRSSNVTNRVTQAQELFSLLSYMVEYVGEDNVIQLITNSAPNYVTAGKLLEGSKQHLYWSPCSAHCIDLMLEDIGKIPNIKEVVKQAVFMIEYIDSHIGVMNLKRKYIGKKKFLRSATTRSASTFLTLKSVFEERSNLRMMFVSTDWENTIWSKEVGGKRCVQNVLSDGFWKDIVYALKLTCPLLGVLRIVGGDKPAMGYIYCAIERAKEAIMKAFNYNEENYKKAIDIVDNRWQYQLRHPLLATGYYLNPSVFYDNFDKITSNEDIMGGLRSCIKRLVRTQREVDAILEELSKYENAVGLFGEPMSIRARKTMFAAEWWGSFGCGTPHLQKFARSVLNLPCSSIGCKRNWSAFQELSRKGIYKLSSDLAFVRCNLSLIRQNDRRERIDPKLLNEIDGSNQWLVGKLDDDDEYVFEDDVSTREMADDASDASSQRYYSKLSAKGKSPIIVGEEYFYSDYETSEEDEEGNDMEFYADNRACDDEETQNEEDETF